MAQFGTLFTTPIVSKEETFSLLYSFCSFVIVHNNLHYHIAARTATDLPYSPIIKECAAELDGEKWSTSKHYPGSVPPPADKTVVHTVQVDASFRIQYGRMVAFSENTNQGHPDPGNFRRIRPIGGLYLSPGEIGIVTVPQELVNVGYTIQVRECYLPPLIRGYLSYICT